MVRSVMGKTTTVRILSTLIAATAGSATVAGIPVEPGNAAQIRQRISIMPESPGLYQRLSVAENLEYFARLYGLPGREARITEALAAVGLSAYAVIGERDRGTLEPVLTTPVGAGGVRRLADAPLPRRTDPYKGGNMTATLKLTRKTFGIELRRGEFETLVDGRGIGSIGYGDTAEEAIEPGHHTLRMRHGRYSSREHSFDVADGDVASFLCSGANLWPLWLVSFVVPSLGIWLRHG
jgi:hypothetical protein